MAAANAYDLEVQIGGISIPFDGFTITSGQFASVGHATIRTGRVALMQAKLDLLKLTENAASLTEVGIWVQPEGQAKTRIFGGEYLNAAWAFDQDMITIHTRDWAGLLVDQKRVLAKIGKAIEKAVAPDVVGRVSPAGISNQNQQVGQIVTAIAQEFGFMPVLNLDSGNNPTMGALYGSSDHVFMTVPQSLWSVLCQLARDTGYDVYVTPDKKLVFGLPGAGLQILKVGHNYDRLPDGVAPVSGLVIEHHPRRNSTFRVMVISHDPARAQLTLGQAVAVGANYAGTPGLTVGVTSGTSAASASAALAKAKVNVKQVPLYTFHVDGLTADQANRQAAALAQRIARRELILSGEIDISPSMLPTQPVKVQGTDVDQEFTGDTFFVSSYTHRFVMPKGHNDQRAGLSTQIKALNLPTQALATGNSG